MLLPGSPWGVWRGTYRLRGSEGSCPAAVLPVAHLPSTPRPSSQGCIFPRKSQLLGSSAEPLAAPRCLAWGTGSESCRPFTAPPCIRQAGKGGSEVPGGVPQHRAPAMAPHETQFGSGSWIRRVPSPGERQAQPFPGQGELCSPAWRGVALIRPGKRGPQSSCLSVRPAACPERGWGRAK